jgi:hypothetical protein
LRLIVLDALDDLGWPVYSRELMLYLRARYGRDVGATRFGTLGSDEAAAFIKRGEAGVGRGSTEPVGRPGPRPVWLCFALTFDRGEAIKRLWARSDWPLERRVMAPTSGRIQHLKMTKRLSELALEAGDTAADPLAMKIIAADHARDLPDVTFRRGDFPLETWRDLAGRMLDDLEPRDEDARRAAADHLGQRPESYRLFGIPDVAAVVDGAGNSRAAGKS